jgi:hypothetical protein
LVLIASYQNHVCVGGLPNFFLSFFLLPFSLC